MSPKTVKKRGNPGTRAPAKANKSGAVHARKKAIELDASKLPIRWQIFIEEYLVDFNGAQAAIRAGYAPTDARSRGSKLLVKPEIAAIVQARVEDRLEAIRLSRDRVLAAFEAIAEADANELSEHRRVCCRHCHGAYDPMTGARAEQMTPAEYVRKKELHDARRAEIKTLKDHDIGEFAVEVGDWYNKNLPIDPDCNECFGDGVGEVILKDTRTLSRRARIAFGGVKEGRDGTEIKMHSREAALAVLAKHHKIFDDAPTVNVEFNAEQLDATFGEAMRKAETRMVQMRMERRAAREARSDLQIGFVAEVASVGVSVHGGPQ